MLSFELLELCEYLPEEGAFKTAVRQGDWCERDQAIMQTANECAVLRAGMVPGADSDQYGSRLFLPPSKLAELVSEAEEKEQMLDRMFSLADRPGGC